MASVVDDVVIVGASVAGVSAADALRAAGFAGRIRLIDAEDIAPYDKPPLTKQALGADWTDHRGALRKPGHYAEHGIELSLGRSVVGFDAGAKELRLADGEIITAGAVVIATGAQPRQLQIDSTPSGVHSVRSLADSRAIRQAFALSPRVVVVGGGFIGLEVASAARQRGLDVTVVELEKHPLGAAIGVRPAKAIVAMHRNEGVDFVTGVGVTGIGGDQQVERVHLADGRTLDADLVIVGLGVAPALGWLDGSGVAIDGGVVCDSYGRTGVPDVYAIGDVAAWTDPASGEATRIEHWTTAQQQGNAVGRTIADPANPQRPPGVPYFWSDQFDARLQSLGRLRAADEIVLRHGGWDDRDFVALYRRGDRLTGAVGMNAARRLMPYRPLIERGERWTSALDAFPPELGQTA